MCIDLIATSRVYPHWTLALWSVAMTGRNTSISIASFTQVAEYSFATSQKFKWVPDRFQALTLTHNLNIGTAASLRGWHCMSLFVFINSLLCETRNIAQRYFCTLLTFNSRNSKKYAPFRPSQINQNALGNLKVHGAVNILLPRLTSLCPFSVST